MLPGKDGYDVCKAIRKTSNTPIIMLTAKETELERVLGLELGADDYITKPFSPLELVARIKDRKSTRLNSSHVRISYAVFCLKKKKKKIKENRQPNYNSNWITLRKSKWSEAKRHESTFN